MKRERGFTPDPGGPSSPSKEHGVREIPSESYRRAERCVCEDLDIWNSYLKLYLSLTSTSRPDPRLSPAMWGGMEKGKKPVARPGLSGVCGGSGKANLHSFKYRGAWHLIPKALSTLVLRVLVCNSATRPGHK